MEGTVMGTPQYMAPEQFEGREADVRADIWAFGAVLYEMVTGQKAFQGKNYSTLLGAILAADPPPMSVKPFTPASLDSVVRRCLAKDPDDRYQSMRDVVLDLQAPQQKESAPAPASKNRWAWVAAGVCLAAALAGWGLWLRGTSEELATIKLSVEPPQGTRFSSIANLGGSAISPDGETLAFSAVNNKGESMMYVRPLNSLEARALPGTANAGRPFWSPDSRSLAFVAESKLKRIDLDGGAPIALCDAASPRGGAWNEEGVILFGDHADGLQRIPASGGTPTFVTKVDKEAGEMYHYYPQFLPDGKRFLYHVRHRDPGKQVILAGSLDGKPPVKIMQSDHRAVHDSQSGRLLYIQGTGTLMARILDPKTLQLTGDPVVVAEGVGLSTNNGYADVSVSSTGTLFYGRGSAEQRTRFAWKDRGGKVLGTVGQEVEGPFSFSLSPDGTKVAYVPAGNQSDVWVLDMTRGTTARITFSNARGPIWSPDGRDLFFNTSSGICRKAADGSGEEVLITKASRTDRAASVSRDGNTLLFGFGDIFAVPLKGEATRKTWLDSKFMEVAPVFSPDGRWVAYASNESGRSEIYIQGYPEHRGKWLISSAGGTFPAWRDDGKEIYWRALDGTLMAAGVEIQKDGIRAGNSEPLFRLFNFSYAVSRDGKRFLASVPEGDQQPDLPMVVVLNWAAKLPK
jgi:Tol biopolymer transport system component